jgi:hypothetical protein
MKPIMPPPRANLLSLSAFALVALAASESAAQAQGLTFVRRTDTLRKPEDVAIAPGGGIAVVRCVDSPDAPPAQSHFDEIMVIKTSGPDAGKEEPEDLHPGASHHGLTLPTGASDLVEATGARAVLIGQKHEGPESNWTTYIDVLDLTGTYGVTSYGDSGPQFLRSFGFSGSGGAHDVAISPDGAWAVVNSRNRIDVIDLDTDAPIGTIPNPTLALTVSTGPSDPSFLRDSVVMTRTAGGTMHAVVLTRKIVGNIDRAVAYVISLSDAAPPTSSAPLELDASNPGIDHPPHDLAITPDDRLAFVTAGGAVGLIDVNAATLITDAANQGGTLREYNDMADSVDLSATQAVVIAKTDIVQPANEFGWQVDVYDIAPGANGLTHRQVFADGDGGNPHDLALGPAGDMAAVRTTQDILVLEGLAQSGGTITLTTVPSATGPLNRSLDNNDSIVITPSWLAFGLPGGPPGGGLVQFAVALARHPTAHAARVDVVNLKDGTLDVDHSELIDGSHWTIPSVDPGSLALARGGRAVIVHCRAKPDDFNEAGGGYGEATGVDTTYLLLGAYPNLTSNYEGWGYLQAGSDSLAVERGAAVFLSNLVPGDVGFVQTMYVD